MTGLLLGWVPCRTQGGSVGAGTLGAWRKLPVLKAGPASVGRQYLGTAGKQSEEDFRAARVDLQGSKRQRDPSKTLQSCQLSRGLGRVHLPHHLQLLRAVLMCPGAQCHASALKPTSSETERWPVSSSSAWKAPAKVSWMTSPGSFVPMLHFGLRRGVA